MWSHHSLWLRYKALHTYILYINTVYSLELLGECCWRCSGTDCNGLRIGAIVVMTGTESQVETVWKGSCAEGIQRHHVLRLNKGHQASGEVTQNTDPTELWSRRQLMGHPCMPSCILPIKVLHAPGPISPAQPAVFTGAFALNSGISDPQLPVSLPTYIHLPVMPITAVSLQADDIEGGVKSSREVGKLLPPVCVGGAVTLRGDHQLWVSRVHVQTHLAGIWKDGFAHSI